MDVLVNYDTMTVEICAAFCASYPYFGVEYSGECYCGIGLQGGSVLSTTASCDMLCDGNQLEYCGGPNRLDVYSSDGVPISVPTPDLPENWTYDGCYVDNVNARILQALEIGNNYALTIETCISQCIAKGYSVAGLEYGLQCFCDDYISYNIALATGVLTNQSNCDITCSGNANEVCGGSSIMSIYSTGKLTSQRIPAPQSGGLPGSWTYQGCRT
jgi:hypothetical protein